MRFLLLLLLPIFSYAQNGLVTIKLPSGSGLAAWNLNGNSIVDSNFLGTTNSKDLIFKTKNVEAMRIDTNGNVGIGTAAPAYNLNVNGSAQIVNRPNGLSVINTIGIGDGNYFPYLLSQDTASLINNQVYLDPVGLGTSILTHGVSLVAIYNGSTYTALKVDTGDMLFFQGSNPGAPDTVMSLKGAKFGIGTASPTAKLHVVGNNIDPAAIFMDGNVGIGTAAPAYMLNIEGSLEANVNYGGLFDDSINNAIRIDSVGSYLVANSAQVNLQQNTMSLAADSGIFIQSGNAGLVGIGTASPTAKLHVNGTTRLEGTPQTTTSDSVLTIDNNGNVNWRTIYYSGKDTLSSGVDTVYTSDITANSIVLLTSNGLNGSTQTGNLDITVISAGNYFVVNSLKTNATIETGDTRIFNWFFIRKP
jgi:hypothetical protein